MIRNKQKTMNYIELFAGCGGLSLGLQSAGFERLFANELSPMAAETYAYNLLNEDLRSNLAEKVFWLGSNFSKENMYERLKENPYDINHKSAKIIRDLDDVQMTSQLLKGSLLVGDIKALNQQMWKRNSVLKQSLSALGEVDIVSGGPPCQSFSMAGMRDRDNHRNRLPWEFARFVSQVKPKIVLLENVEGILRAFKEGENKYYAWFEVAKVFAKKGYVPLCLKVNAKYVGVAQNRPRFIMLAFRKDVAEAVLTSHKFQKLSEELQHSTEFFRGVRKGLNVPPNTLPVLDVNTNRDFFVQAMPSLLSHEGDRLISVRDAIDDLRNTRVRESDYVRELNRQYVCLSGKKLNKYKNHTLRQNGNIVRARFRLYQVLKKFEAEERLSVVDRLKKGEEVSVSRKLLKKISRHWLLTIEGEKIEAASVSAVLSLIDQLATRKHSQRALDAELPAPAVLASQDDSCHYHESLSSLRSLTIREIARIQSFPDWFEMRSKETTGGLRRRFEVPQYTQVGNAVPPRLGKVLGEICRELLSAI